MTPASRAELRKDVMQAEGTGPVKDGRFLPYTDTVGVLTIGWGRNLARGITTLEAEVLLDHDLADAELECRRAFAWFSDLSEIRQRAITEMAFNLGLSRLQGFTKTLAAIAAKDYALAADQMMASRWAKQIKSRAVRLARMMRDGR